VGLLCYVNFFFFIPFSNFPSSFPFFLPLLPFPSSFPFFLSLLPFSLSYPTDSTVIKLSFIFIVSQNLSFPSTFSFIEGTTSVVVLDYCYFGPLNLTGKTSSLISIGNICNVFISSSWCYDVTSCSERAVLLDQSIIQDVDQSIKYSSIFNFTSGAIANITV
jgi:hypothetical protein